MRILEAPKRQSSAPLPCHRVNCNPCSSRARNVHRRAPLEPRGKHRCSVDGAARADEPKAEYLPVVRGHARPAPDRVETRRRLRLFEEANGGRKTNGARHVGSARWNFCAPCSNSAIELDSVSHIAARRIGVVQRVALHERVDDRLWPERRGARCPGTSMDVHGRTVECRNTDGQVARASRRCALVALIKAASLARTGAARHSPTTAGDWIHSFLLKSSRRSLNYFVLGIDRTSSSTKSVTRLRIASSAAVKPSLRGGTSSQRTSLPRGCGSAARSHPIEITTSAAPNSSGRPSGLRNRNRVASPFKWAATREETVASGSVPADST